MHYMKEAATKFQCQIRSKSVLKRKCGTLQYIKNDLFFCQTNPFLYFKKPTPKLSEAFYLLGIFVIVFFILYINKRSKIQIN